MNDYKVFVHIAGHTRYRTLNYILKLILKWILLPAFWILKLS